MATDVVLPRLSMTMDEAVIIEWLVKEGQAVRKGDPLLVIETDKANTEVAAEASGVVQNMRAHPGDRVAVGTVIAEITAESASPQPPVAKASPVAQRMADAHGLALATLQGTGHHGRVMEADVRAVLQSTPERVDTFVRASPYARRLAAEAGIALSQISPSHYTGRLVARDVRKFIANRTATPAAQTAVQAERVSDERVSGHGQSPAVQPMPSTVPVRAAVTLTGIRATIVKHMATSAHTTAPVTLTTETDATALVEARRRLQVTASRDGNASPSYNDLLIRATALALAEHPGLNARLNSDQIEYLADINIGLAVDTERGLLVPVVRQANSLGLQAISRITRELTERVRAGNATLADLAGGTFTITNLGMYEIDAFTPIINLPETAILGVGRIREQIVPDQGRPVVRWMVWLSLTFDHRLVDGAPAARFLQRIKQLVEEPFLMLG